MGVTNLFHKPFHFEFYVLTTVLHEVFEQYLNFRQYRFIKTNLSGDKSYLDKKPANDKSHAKTLDSLKVYLESGEYHKTLEYSYDKLKFRVFSSLFHLVLNMALLFTLFSPKVWKFSGKLLKRKSEYLQSLVFCGLKLFLDTLVDIPFGLYSDFVLEEKHGFNKKTLKLFAKDLLVTLSLECGIGGPFLVAVIFLVNWGGERFYLYVFGFIVVFNFVMIVVYPELIAPLFNKFEPLADQELKEEIENLAKKLHFPLKEIKQMDGSKRSSHSNAYFYGFWKFKKIVVFDTLLATPRNQILAVVSHELGHWKHKHFYSRVLFSYVNIFAMFFLFKAFKNDKNMYNSFGFHGVNAFVIGITLFSNVFSCFGILIKIVELTMTRYQEHQADRFAVNIGMGEDLVKSLVTLEKDNKSMIYNDSLYSWYHYTHPVLFERVYAVYQAMAKKKV